MPALRELESACRASILRDAVTVPTVCFSGFSEGRWGGQQQFATQPSAAPRPFARSRVINRRRAECGFGEYSKHLLRLLF